MLYHFWYCFSFIYLFVFFIIFYDLLNVLYTLKLIAFISIIITKSAITDIISMIPLGQWKLTKTVLRLAAAAFIWEEGDVILHLPTNGISLRRSCLKLERDCRVQLGRHTQDMLWNQYQMPALSHIRNKVIVKIQA
jgi:hypothetical protein